MYTFLRRVGCWIIWVVLPLTLSAQTNTFDFTNLMVSIPDNDPNGIQVSEAISGVSGSIASISVSLDLLGTPNAFNGDYYIELINSSGQGLAVLLNRTGVESGNAYGYGDNGFDVTFSDSAADDIHFYQNDGYTLNADGQLTGTWQPDGENINPLGDPSTFDDALSDQTATLSSFDGESPDQIWTLYLADLSGGGMGELAGWSLTIVTAPEPPVVGLLGGGLLLLGFMARRRKVFRLQGEQRTGAPIRS